MLIRGEWFQCDDEAVRPVLRAEVRDVAGNWIEALFLIDTGADRTVFNSAVFSHLRFAAAAGESRLRSLAGITKGTDLDTTVRLWADTRQ
jgi:hypothetical protein